MLASPGVTDAWKGLLGLRNKYFTLYGNSQGASFYTWTSKKSLDNYMKS